MEKIKKIMQKLLNKEVILYVVFGIFTTIVNLASFYILTNILHWEENVSNILAILLAVIFAYITNKIFVFQSKNWKYTNLIIEFGEFVGARLFSLGFEEVGLFFSQIILHFDERYLRGINCLILAKIILSFVSVLLNYFASKLIVFKGVKNESTNDNSCL